MAEQYKKAPGEAEALARALATMGVDEAWDVPDPYAVDPLYGSVMFEPVQDMTSGYAESTLPLFADLTPLGDADALVQGAQDRSPLAMALAALSFGLPGTIKPVDDVITPEVKALGKSARGHFGVTYNPKEAGYILPDGEMLDFSGRHYATGYKRAGAESFRPEIGQPDYLGGGRAVDHRELADLIDSGGTEGMFDFQNNSGAIRYMQGSGASMTTIPTSEQIESLVKAHRKTAGREPLYIDLDDPVSGYTVKSLAIESPTVENVTRAIDDLVGERESLSLFASALNRIKP